ncbi:MAG: hypothetical protein VB104_07025 [Candidatus Limiplasma sp.]|nr:hypothetical protein [Candidatus Limiplasma sp.]
MRKILTLLVIVLLLSPTIAFSESTQTATSYAFLDNMSLQELLALQDEVASRIAANKANKAANNPDDLGMWELRYYVDEFGNPSEQGYITNTKWNKGEFSNSATEGAALNAQFLIDIDDVALKLYEYAGSNPLKVYNTTVYDVSILASDGQKYTCQATEYSDRLYLPRDVLDIFSQNGKTSFYVAETGSYASSTYNFTIADTSYIGNAIALLTK